MKKQRQSPSLCPQCGTPLKSNAPSCPECGSDWDTGWAENAGADWESPDYEELREQEFGEKPTPPPLSRLKILAFAALALLLGLLLVGI